MNAQHDKPNIETDLNHAIQKGEDIVFVTYSLLEDTGEKIKFALAKILEKYRRDDLFTPIYSCLKELMANSTKANAKKILIDEGIINNPGDPMEVVEKIRTILNERSLLEYGIKAKGKKLSTRTYLTAKDNSLTIKVINLGYTVIY